MLKFVLCVILLVYTASLIFPVVWALITSLKSYDEYAILENVTGLPTLKSFKDIVTNYITAWQQGYSYATIDGQMVYFTIPEQMFNSLVYALGCTITATMTPCLTAYVCARYPFKFSTIIYNVVIIAMIIPFVGTQSSTLEIVRALGMYDTFWGLWIMKANFLGTYFLVFYAQFKMIPATYTEAARIDGASEFYVMRRVILPLAKGTIGTVGILQFIVFWNDYQTPMIYQPSYPTLAYGMYQFSKRTGAILASVPMRVSYMIVVVVPILILFLLLRKKLVGNISMGGIKG